MRATPRDMERIGVRELRQHASRYLAKVKRGETVEVTDRGELVALLVPAPHGTTARERLIAEGRLVPGRGGPVRLPVRRPLRPGEPGTAEVLDALRAERLP